MIKKLEEQALYLTQAEVDRNLEIASLLDQLIATEKEKDAANEERDRVIRELEALEEECEADATVTAIIENDLKQHQIQAMADAETIKQLTEVADRVDREEQLRELRLIFYKIQQFSKGKMWRKLCEWSKRMSIGNGRQISKPSTIWWRH